MSSRIEWLARPGTKPEAWNPVTGCTKVSAGCKYCYAERQAERFWPTHYVHTIERGLIAAKDYRGERCTGKLRVFTDVMCHEDRLSLPLKWAKPRTVFVNSMSDLFHPAVPDAFIDQVFAVMALSPCHTFIVLTKRPGRMLEWMNRDPRDGVRNAGEAMRPSRAWPLPNVWLGVSIENQETADQRIPLLLQTPASVRFVSYEPALGPVNFREVACREDWHIDAFDTPDESCRIHWVIVGGESGPKARPCDVAWIRTTMLQCHNARVPVFVKQLGANAMTACAQCGRTVGRCVQGGFVDACGPTHAAVIAELVAVNSNKGNDPTEWPDDLRVREWPAVRT